MTDPLAPLRERFRARAADDLKRLDALLAGDRGSAELRMLVHNIAGAAGTFGFPALSETAGAIDDDYYVDAIPDDEAFGRLRGALRVVAGNEAA